VRTDGPHDIEIIVVDIGPIEAAKLAAQPGARVVYTLRPDIVLWSQARSMGLAQAGAPVVAFMEDHCFPQARWAESLLDP
jgi:Glycosyl transferase family 2